MASQFLARYSRTDGGCAFCASRPRKASAAISSQCDEDLHSRDCASVVKAVAHLHENFPWIQKVCPAESKTVVEKHPPVGHVDGLNDDR